ncbi:MAG: hypothetical protein GPJ54_11915 [Candidatus Heimdallarchaeota archaeon]|nr:hypothetical protein [Candidatus Heimdallarchaeota archaeon]
MEIEDLVLYILLISKQFHSQLLGQSVIIAFLFASIAFSFVAVLFLKRQLGIEITRRLDSKAIT